MTHSYVWHDAFICVTWRIHMCDMTHSYVWQDAFICVTWRIHMCDMTHSYVWHDAFICVTWRLHMCDMTHSYVWHDAFIRVISHVSLRVPWLIWTYDMTHSHICNELYIRLTVLHDLFRYETWLMQMWAWLMGQNAFCAFCMLLDVALVIHMNEACQTHKWVVSHTWMSHVRTCEWFVSCHTCERVMSHSMLWLNRAAPRTLLDLTKRL